MDATTGGLTLSCAADDSLRIWETDTGAVRVRTDGDVRSGTGADVTAQAGIMRVSTGSDIVVDVYCYRRTGRCQYRYLNYSA